MFILKPELFQLAGFNQNCFWLLTRCFILQANNGTKLSFPSYTTIAKDCGWSRSKAIMVVQQLVELGLITKETRLKKHARNRYSLNTDMVLVTVTLKAKPADFYHTETYTYYA